MMHSENTLIKNQTLLKIKLLWAVNHLHSVALVLIFCKPAVASFT